MLNEIFLEEKLRQFLSEDLKHAAIDFSGEIVYVTAEIIAEESGTFCGGAMIESVLNLLLPRRTYPEPIRPVNVLHLHGEGKPFHEGTVLARFVAERETLRHGIRTVLNLVQHCTRIATHTRLQVNKLRGYQTELLDTRKTTPGLREFEKYAVRTGGGRNHRFGRYDGILIKKEDIKIDGGITRAIDRAMRERSHLEGVEIEVETSNELDAVLEDGRVRQILLDNMDTETLRRAVERCGSTHILEASGIGKRRLEAIAATGVHFISISSLVRNAPPINLRMVIAE